MSVHTYCAHAESNLPIGSFVNVPRTIAAYSVESSEDQNNCCLRALKTFPDADGSHCVATLGLMYNRFEHKI
jgi:hypothetical protein